MIYAGNDVALDTNGKKFPLDEGDIATKLTIQVFTNRVFLQVSEAYPVVFTDSSSHEMVLEKGFHSREFLTPITGFKFRAEANPAKIHFVAYG